MAQTPQDVFQMIKDHDVKILDLRFIDFPGIWQHFSARIDVLDEESFEDGFGFDGSSIRGWKAINESDMLVIPDPTTAFIDPFLEASTLVMICDIADPITRSKYTKDPRSVARKAENHLAATGIADTCYFGPEAEFFVFDDIRFDQTTNAGYYFVDSVEGRWNTGSPENPHLGYKPRYKEGYFPVPPTDSLQDMRSEMILTMIDCGIEVEQHHHEVATGGQCEIDFT